jgi:hypothetical protein
VHIVPVPVDKGFAAAPRAIDLKANFYLQFLVHDDGIVNDMEDNMSMFFPLGMPYQWTVFRSEHVRFITSFAQDSSVD